MIVILSNIVIRVKVRIVIMVVGTVSILTSVMHGICGGDNVVFTSDVVLSCGQELSLPLVRFVSSI